MNYEFDLSVVIPCLNEEETVETCIKKCLKSFEALGINGEVVVSDNGSVDGTTKLSEKLGARVELCIEKGYGCAIRYGFNKAKGKYIIMGDGDNSYDFSLIPDFYNKIVQCNCDMVIGTRLKGKIHKGAMPFLHRYLGNPVLTFILNMFFGARISDSQCGMRMFKKESLEKLDLVTTGMEFASELMVKAAWAKFKIVEIPIEFFKDGRSRKPYLRTWRDGWRHLTFLVISKCSEFGLLIPYEDKIIKHEKAFN
ncbi:MAG TPA: glycosyltransferase family 2 protein [Candidatus Gastranaerophilales bacterium]|nr:glycosyltransferase family 2 protein [Candidatus Gastranaerophilales bacterium]